MGEMFFIGGILLVANVMNARRNPKSVPFEDWEERGRDSVCRSSISSLLGRYFLILMLELYLSEYL